MVNQKSTSLASEPRLFIADTHPGEKHLHHEDIDSGDISTVEQEKQNQSSDEEINHIKEFNSMEQHVYHGTNGFYQDQIA